MLLIPIILLFTFGGTTALWRVSINPQPNYHFVVKSMDYGMNYIYGFESLIMKQNALQNTQPWLFDSSCHQNVVNNTLKLCCPRNGKYRLGVQTNCPSCTNESILIRIIEVPHCYFWYVAIQKQGKDYLAQIRVETLDQEKFDMSTVLTKLFHSRGQKPVMKTVVSTPYLSKLVYNASAFHWSALLSQTLVSNSPYLKVDSAFHIPIAGCVIAPVVFYIKKFAPHSEMRQIPLQAGISMNGHVHYHSCFPHTSILLTANGVFFTNDDFLSSTQLFISQMYAGRYSNRVDAAAVSPEEMFVILDGSILKAQIKQENLTFEIETMNVNNANFLGITTTPNCLLSSSLRNSVAWENTYAAAWNISHLFITNRHDVNWTVYSLPFEFLESSVVSARLGTIPGDIAVLIVTNNVKTFLNCMHHTNDTVLSNCTAAMHPFQANTIESVEFEFLPSANPSLLVWTSTEVGFIYDNGRVIGKFWDIDSIKMVSFSNDHSKYLIQSSDNRLFYGSGRCRKLLKLRQVDAPGATNIFYKFQFIGDRPLRIEWMVSGSLIVKREIFPLESEVYAKMHEDQNGMVCDNLRFLSNFYQYKGNVRNLESRTDFIEIDYSLVYPSLHPVSVSFIVNSRNIIKMSEPVESIQTRVLENNITLRVKTLKTHLTGTCDNTTCPTGLAAVEVQAMPLNGGSMCMLPLTQLMHINVTCPDGLHIRIRNSSGSSCGSFQNNENCMETIVETWMFDPIVDLYSFGDHLYTISDDVSFREINNKTGFELEDKNILTKDCYLCSQFRQSESSNVLFMQTTDSACPCQLEKYGQNNWIRKITFEDVLPAPGMDEDYVFDVTVLGNSFCLLSTRFTIRISMRPVVAFALWEYIVILVFVTISIVVLIVSYYNYMKFMREAKKKLS